LQSWHQEWEAMVVEQILTEGSCGFLDEFLTFCAQRRTPRVIFSNTSSDNHTGFDYIWVLSSL